MTNMYKYFYQILIALSQLGNTLTGGMADETISARSYRTNSIMRPIIDAIFFFDPEHCYKSYLNEFERKHLPNHYLHNEDYK